MSDATDRLRERVDTVRTAPWNAHDLVILEGPLAAAMLDVIEAAESCITSDVGDEHWVLIDALARFREVADE